MTPTPVPSDTTTRHQREARLQQRAFVVWFTGLPCSGKTTLATALQQRLSEQGLLAYVLDGDELRRGLNADLGYGPDDRRENIRRAAEASKLLVANGVVTLSCFITPSEALRLLARQIIGDADFIEVFVKCPVEECERRDVKGLYRKARAGDVKDFTGVSAPYEEPMHADVVVDTVATSVDRCVGELFDIVAARAVYK